MIAYDESQVGGMVGGVVSATRRLVTGTVRRIDAHSLAMDIRLRIRVTSSSVKCPKIDHSVDYY